MNELEKRIIALEAEVQLLKQLLVSQLQPNVVVSQQPPQCSCPIIGVPHSRGPSCKDTWVICNV